MIAEADSGESMPFAASSRANLRMAVQRGDAPDRRRIGKDTYGTLLRFVSTSKAGVYATHLNEHSAKPEGL
jgi:hypothetical protein